MKLREIHIDGFGIFNDRHILGLSSGINIIYGPNEFGKSTLLAFIRRVLFGFPTKASKENPYPALSSAAYGGKLQCQLSNGRTITISRKQGPFGGAVTITTDSEELSGKEDINKLLDNISNTFYENVYAIGLEELEAVASLANEEIKNHIYGASLGLGNTTLTEIKDIFTKKAGEIFTTGVARRKITNTYDDIRKLEKSISEMQKELSQYDELVQQRDQLADEVNSLDKQITEYQKTVGLLERKKELFPVYIALVNTEKELGDLPDTPEFAPGSLTKLEQIEDKVESLQEQIEDEAKLLTELELKNKRLACNEQILAQEPTVIDLQKRSELYTSAIKDITPVTSERNSLRSDIDKEITKIGAGWTEESIRNFELSHLQKDRVNSYRQKFSDVKDRVDDIRTKLDYHNEKKASEPPRRFQGPVIYKYAAYAIAVLGLIGIVIGFIFSILLLSLFSAIFFILGISIAVSLTKGKQAAPLDELEKKYHEDLNSALQDEGKLNQEWQDFLSTINFPAELTPDGAIQVSNAIEIVQAKINSLDQLNGRIGKMQNTIGSVTELHRKLTTCLDKLILSGNIEADIVIFAQQLSTAQQAKQEKESLEKQNNQKASQIASLNEKKGKAETELKNCLVSHHASDEQDFRLKYETFKKREKLKEERNRLETTIQTITGTGDRYTNFRKSLSETSEEEIVSQLNEARSKLRELEEKRDPEKEQIGGLKTSISQLSSNEDLIAKQEEVEIKKQQLHDYSRDWAKTQIALYVLDKAVSKYEDTRQPAVIDAATGIFASITNGAYPKIIKPIDSDEFKIRDENENTKSVKQMSRGTMEQLFLALRLGLIKVYEDQAEPMPIIMDDILVNFDDDRGPLAIKALAEFAKNRQVIVLTCHKNVLQIYKSFGAREITFS